MRRIAALFAVVAVAAAGCGGDGGDDDAAPTVTTPSDIANAVFERAYSECASNPVNLLASKYKVKANRNAVAAAVGHEWATRFQGEPDAVELGRDACLQGFDDPA